MKYLLPVTILLLLCALTPIACTQKPVDKPVEKPPEKKEEPKDKVDPNMPKIG